MTDQKPAGDRMLSEDELVTLVHGSDFHCPTCGHNYARHLSTKAGCKDCPGAYGYDHPGRCPETMTTALGKALAPGVERIVADRVRALTERVEAVLPSPEQFDRARKRIRATYTAASERGMMLGSLAVEEKLANKIRAVLAADEQGGEG